MHDHIRERIDRGRKAISMLAAGRALTLEECADVLCFIIGTELLDPKSQKDPDPYMGFFDVMTDLIARTERGEKLTRKDIGHGWLRFLGQIS